MTEQEHQAFMAMEKEFVNKGTIILPSPKESKSYSIQSLDKREQFILDVRDGTYVIKSVKYTFHHRVSNNIGLVRADFGNRIVHQNPNHEIINGSHLHYFREGYDLRWAKPFTEVVEGFAIENFDSAEAFQWFCKYNKVKLEQQIQANLLGGLYG